MVAREDLIRVCRKDSRRERLNCRILKLEGLEFKSFEVFENWCNLKGNVTCVWGGGGGSSFEVGESSKRTWVRRG